MNRIEIAGYTAAPAELRYLPSGTKVANLRLGESHRYRAPDDQVVTQTNWHSLTFYNALADLAVKFAKGTNLFVVGSLQQRKFTPKDQPERTVHEVIVQSCHVIGSTTPNATSAADDLNLASHHEQHTRDENDDGWPV